MPETVDPAYIQDHLTIRYRVGGVMKNRAVKVFLDDDAVLTRKRKIMAPGEMEEVLITKAMKMDVDFPVHLCHISGAGGDFVGAYQLRRDEFSLFRIKYSDFGFPCSPDPGDSGQPDMLLLTELFYSFQHFFSAIEPQNAVIFKSSVFHINAFPPRAVSERPVYFIPL